VKQTIDYVQISDKMKASRASVGASRKRSAASEARVVRNKTHAAVPMTIEVVNIRTVSTAAIHNGGAIYIGRANPSYGLAQSPLANPYKLTSEAERDAVLEQYRQWLWRELRRSVDTPAARELRRLLTIWQHEGVLYLACWCAPKICHGDVVKRAIEWLQGQGK
jgi:hypothetical protein